MFRRKHADRERIESLRAEAERERKLEEGRLAQLQAATPGIIKLTDDLVRLGNQNGFGRAIEQAYRLKGEPS